MVAGAGWWIAIVLAVAHRLAARTSAARRRTASSTSRSATTASAASPATRTAASPAATRWAGAGPASDALVDSANGGQIAWLLPAVVILGLAALWFLRRAPRTDARRAVLLVFGSWLVVTWLVFSYMQGIYHEYYTVALAVPMAVVAGAGAGIVWRHRREVLGAVVLAGGDRHDRAVVGDPAAPQPSAGTPGSRPP